MASIREVAKFAHVAPSTVSRALNGSGYVAQETMEKIQKAVTELDYIPNQWIRNLYRKKAGIIGVMAPDLIHPYFSSLWNRMEHEFHQCGYNIMLCNTAESFKIEREYLDTLERNLFDGMVVGAAQLPDKYYTNIKKPILSLDRIIPGIPLITSDHRQGGQMAAKKLLSNGCRHVMLTTNTEAQKVASAQGGKAFLQCMQEGGATVVAEDFKWNDVIDYTRSIRRARVIMEAHPNLDGLMVNDLIAASFLKVARERRISVPKQLKVIAYDGTYITDFNYKTISSVVQDVSLLAKKATEVLLKLINKEPIPDERIFVPMHFKAGDTLYSETITS